MTSVKEKLLSFQYRPAFSEDSTFLQQIATKPFFADVELPADYVEFMRDFPLTGFFDKEVVSIGIEPAPCASDRRYPLAVLYASSRRPSHDLRTIRSEQSMDGDLPMTFLIIGADSGGNNFCLDLQAEQFGKVKFRFHEEDWTTGLYLLSDSFSDFITKIEAVDS